MNEAVSDIIALRSRDADGLSRAVVWSLGVHVVIGGLLLVMPRGAPEPPRTLMTISLGGAPGPRAGGLTQAGGRTVQATPPPDQPVKRVETPPAPKPPPMTLPDPKPRPRTQPKPPQAPPDATSRTVSTGEKPREGSTRSETGARGQGFGLSSAGGGAGTSLTLDVQDFCCREYLDEMVRRVQMNWNQNQGIVGSTIVRFTIERDGSLQGIQVERSSGFVALDQSALRAMQVTAVDRLPPLPAPFPNPTLTVHLRFDYQR